MDATGNPSSHINPVTGHFRSNELEQAFRQQQWPTDASGLRTPVLILSSLILLSSVLDYRIYQFTDHFWWLFCARCMTAALGLTLFFLSLRSTPPPAMRWLLPAFQLVILLFWWLLFLDRFYISPAGMSSETFYTVLLITYPLLISLAIRGHILLSLGWGLMALGFYLLSIDLLPAASFTSRITELLTFLFSLIYAYQSQNQLNQAQRRAYLSELQQQETLAQLKSESQHKSRFIAATCHDLRQPVTALQFHLELLNRSPEPTTARHLLSNAQLSVTQLSDLMAGLLDLSELDKTEHIQTQPVRLDYLLNKLILLYRPIAENAGLQLRQRIRPCTVMSHPLYLQRCVQNLLNNAIKYSDQGQILVSCRPRGDQVEIAVYDQGIGIPSDDQQKIFDEYYQLDNPERSREKGHGLGLSIVLRICKLLGHGIRVRSTPGHGSCFSLTLQSTSKMVKTGTEYVVEALPSRLSDRAILLIEDDPQVQLSLSQLMEQWGARVQPVNNADEAFAAIQAGMKPDLILSDHRLPGAMNGSQLLQKLKQDTLSHVPALLISGESVDISQKSAINRFLQKPFRPAKLRATLYQLLSST